MVPIEIEDAYSSRRPVGRSERVQVVLIGHPRQTSEYVTHIGERIFAVTLTRDDDRVNDRGALAGVGVPDKKPVFLSDGRRPDGIFDQVVIQTRFAVINVGGECVPVAQQVIARFGQAGLRGHALADTGRQFLQPIQPPGIVLTSMPLSLRRIQFIFIPARFAFVQPADDKQHDPHRLGPFTLSFKKLPPRMRLMSCAT